MFIKEMVNSRSKPDSILILICYLYKMSPLTIYKASAGSGKTFKLTLGYMELLFRNPQSYRHILAVTFTNKAASEMKSRILERLFRLSELKDGELSEDLRELMRSTGLPPSEITDRSGKLLVSILNDYSRFSVGTIDRFFQGVIRAFAREIGLPAGFSLELDRDRILGEAVDRMFMDLGEDSELLEWMLRLAESRVEASRGWNFRGEIISLGEQLFTESYQQVLLESENRIGRDQLQTFIAALNKIKESAQKNIRDIADGKIQEIGEAGYAIDDFYRKASGLAGFFVKAARGEKDTLTEAQKQGITDLSKWISKNESDQDKISFIEYNLMPGMAAIYEEVVLLQSAAEVGQYIFALGILGDISKKILDITDEKNQFLLSDASRFLKGLIGSNPAPYIYEKTGSYIEHIMLDEFQDTSAFQWENFRPLLDHTLSMGRENIIVGDVKQSIYRWRNSDWKILAGAVEHAFGAHTVKKETLKENWRSSEWVIRFNNTLFTHAPVLIRGMIDEALESALVSPAFMELWTGLLDIAYAGVVQEIPEKALGTGGYVRADILADEERTFQEQALEEIPGWIRELQDNGYEAGQIAILVRTNREGAAVARMLMELLREEVSDSYNYNFVSSDSLFLDHNMAVRFLVSLMKYLRNGEDHLNNISVCYYHRLLFGGTESDPSDALKPGMVPEEELGERFTGQIHTLQRLPLFELAETLIELFGLDTRTVDLPYIQAFQELILDLQQQEPGSLHDFLVFWEDAGYKKSITVSGDQDAIRIITIHKAKGLQYKAVIVPFCNWDLTTSGSQEKILWSSTEGTPFSGLPVVPLKFRSSLKETLFAEDYMEELIMGYVDNLNLLYVAFTRAEEALIVGLPGAGDGSKIKNAGELVMQAVHTSDPMLGPQGMDLDAASNDHGFGVGQLIPQKRESAPPSPLWAVSSYPVKFRNDRIRLRLKSTGYFSQPSGPEGNHLDFGNIMHEIFGMIDGFESIQPAVDQYNREGVLTGEQSKEMIAMIREKIVQPEVAPWFDGRMKVINERDIISGGEVYRPDRVMVDGARAVVIDYKFGDTVLPRYEKQVHKYMELLNAIGYQPVEGYLWYVMLNRIVKVE